MTITIVPLSDPTEDERLRAWNESEGLLKIDWHRVARANNRAETVRNPYDND